MLERDHVVAACFTLAAALLCFVMCGWWLQDEASVN